MSVNGLEISNSSGAVLFKNTSVVYAVKSFIASGTVLAPTEIVAVKATGTNAAIYFSITNSRIYSTDGSAIAILTIYPSNLLPTPTTGYGLVVYAIDNSNLVFKDSMYFPTVSIDSKVAYTSNYTLNVNNYRASQERYILLSSLQPIYFNKYSVDYSNIYYMTFKDSGSTITLGNTIVTVFGRSLTFPSGVLPNRIQILQA